MKKSIFNIETINHQFFFIFFSLYNLKSDLSFVTSRIQKEMTTKSKSHQRSILHYLTFQREEHATLRDKQTTILSINQKSIIQKQFI